MKNSIIKATILIQLLLGSYNLSSQNDSINNQKSSVIDKKYIMWASPSKANHVYGLMFNVWAKDSMPFPIIYGVEFNICPLGVFAPFLISIYSLDLPHTFNLADDMTDTVDYSKFKKVNGCQIGFINTEPTIINGLDINASDSFQSVTNGVTLSVATNNHYEVNGLIFASIVNSDDKCRGVQIAMFNSCNDLKGFQFGLWNKNQRRSLPLINWAFKS